ncbi:MAG TPA: glucokinase [Candidatus Obscuribacterales bacterium]
MTILLAGDIGGTKTILRLVQTEGDRLTTLGEQTYASGEFADLVPMVRRFLQDTQRTETPPVNACFAIAGPVVNNTSALTNLSWSLEGDRLEDDLGLQHVQLINDFAAVGYGVLGLTADDLHTLQAGQPDPSAPIAVIGAGTGLGQGFLIATDDDHRIFPSEGGHADFAPRSELEFQLLKYLLEKNQITRISAERVVSGQGIVAIYQFLRDRQVAQESPEMAEIMLTWEQEIGKAEKSVDPAAAISQAAAQKDHLCEQTMQLFIGAYGAEAGNLALKLLPYGGLYIAGGIAAKNLELMSNGCFMQALQSKGRVSKLLDQVPVHVVLNPRVGLIGAALRASRL